MNFGKCNYNTNLFQFNNDYLFQFIFLMLSGTSLYQQQGVPVWTFYWNNFLRIYINTFPAVEMAASLYANKCWGPILTDHCLVWGTQHIPPPHLSDRYSCLGLLINRLIYMSDKLSDPTWLSGDRLTCTHQLGRACRVHRSPDESIKRYIDQGSTLSCPV